MMRSSSPAMSEISVGSPSPPPAACYPLNMKRLRCGNVNSTNFLFPAPHVLPARRKSTAERVKSFSIADILGKGETSCSTQRALTPPPLTLQPNIPQVPLVGNPLIAERLQPHMVSPALVMLDLPGLSKVMPNSWDSARHLPLNHPPGLNPFFPPALLHYEQRLAWDYQRQLQEHFQTQAQLLRQMSMDPNIIPSEDGSERSRSSSGGSQCCSPEVNVGSSGGEDEKTNSPRPEGSSHGRKSVERKCDKDVGSRSDKGDKNIKLPNDTPLNALFQLSTKNFDEDQDPTTLSIFAARPNPKKKRKSRTAFTNHQIFELEKRFLYQKYLSPADRDEIAASLGLSNAQVITWFQNRRAKLKRDMEELKKDVESVKQLSAHKSFLENVNDLSILKTRPASRHHHPQQQQQSQLTEVHGTAAAAHGQLSPLYAPPPTAPTTAAAAGLLLPPCQQQQLQHIIQPANTSTCNKSPHYNTTNTDNRSRNSSYSGNSINRNVSINEATTIQQQQQQQQQQSNRHYSQNNSSRG